jgi:hypothetical protein
MNLNPDTLGNAYIIVGLYILCCMVICKFTSKENKKKGEK